MKRKHVKSFKIWERTEYNQSEDSSNLNRQVGDKVKLRIDDINVEQEVEIKKIENGMYFADVELSDGFSEFAFTEDDFEDGVYVIYDNQAGFSQKSPSGTLLDDVTKELLDYFDFGGDDEYESISTVQAGDGVLLSVITSNEKLAKNDTFVGEIDIMLYDNGKLKIQGTTEDEGTKDIFYKRTISSVDDYIEAVGNIDDKSLWNHEKAY